MDPQICLLMVCPLPLPLCQLSVINMRAGSSLQQKSVSSNCICFNSESIHATRFTTTLVLSRLSCSNNNSSNGILRFLYKQSLTPSLSHCQWSTCGTEWTHSKLSRHSYGTHTGRRRIKMNVTLDKFQSIRRMHLVPRQEVKALNCQLLVCQTWSSQLIDNVWYTNSK